MKNWKNWFRWKYILPRLGALAVLLLCCEFGSGPLVRFLTIQAGQAALGAKVEIAGATASVLKTNATLTGIAVADPRDPMLNLVEADRLSLDLSSDDALRKRLVVSEGELSGLRFGVARDTSGELPGAEAVGESQQFQLPKLVGSQAAQAWLSGVQERFAGDLELESVRLAKELRQKWPAEYSALETRAKKLQADIQLLKQQVKTARENPLRNVEFLKSVPDRLSHYKEELAGIKNRFQQLPQQIEQDRQAVQAARRHDEAALREKLAMKDMDARSLSTYLLGEQLAAPMGELVGWLKWARTLAPSKAKRPAGARGVEVRFAGCQRKPAVLIESLKLSGAARLAGMPLEFNGLLTDATTQPKVLRRPMLLSVTTTGAAPIELRAKIDRTGEVAVDDLIADCTAIALPQMQLGKPDALGLSVAPSEASLSVSLNLTGEELSGDVQIVQRNVRITPHVKASLGGVLQEEDLQRALAHHLSQTPKLVTTVSLSGNLDSPEWSVWSTAGPAVAEAMNAAIRTLATDRANQLLAKGQQEVNQQLGALDQEIHQMNTLVQNSLGGPAKALQGFAGGQGGIGDIGSRLAPVGSLFK